MRELFESAIAQPRFNMNQVCDSFIKQSFGIDSNIYRDMYTQLVYSLNQHSAYKVLQGLIRFAFFIEPVKTPKIETTKYAVRWGPEINIADPRHCAYDDCLSIFDMLFIELLKACEDVDKKRLLQSFTIHSMIPYELPIDYTERKVGETIHEVQNVSFFWGELPQRAIALRAFLLSLEQPLNLEQYKYANFFQLAYDKIKVKSYLTDRVLTGEHKTNREKRWETHPESVHFALRRDCLGIEVSLINQLCFFDGFEVDVQRDLEKRGLIAFEELHDSELSSSEEHVSRCPITLEPLSFEDIRDELFNPRHGKAAYQVGHLHPLKASTDNPYTGHTAKNISWISSQGNRIQGEYSVVETRDLILRIINNYREAGLVK